MSRSTISRIAALLPERETLKVPTLLRYERDARVVATRYLDFYKLTWDLWRASVVGLAFRADILSTVTLVHPRHGLARGSPLLVVGIGEDPGTNVTTLTLFGGVGVGGRAPR